MNRQIDQQLELLEKAVEAITEGEEYQRYLKIMARFPSYSIRNTMLIYAQKPDATFVAGYQAWQSLFGRHVRKGEKGIRILAPYTYYKTDEEDGRQNRKAQTGFRAISVFDISQTEGRPLPELPCPQRLSGTCQYTEGSRPALEACTGFSIKMQTLPDGMCGRCLYQERVIQVHDGLEEAHTFKTMIHECAHALLHSFEYETASGFEMLLETRQDLREIEAESVSFLVCSALGIDSSDYSFQYIAGWKKQASFLPQSLQRIADTARHLLAFLSPDAAVSIQDQKLLS